MSDGRPDPSTPTTPPPPSAGAAGVPLLLRPRREPFEYGLLPIPKLIFSDGTLTLGPLRDKLLGLSSPCSGVDALALAEALQISPDLARLVLDTLASVLPSDTPDPAGTADVYDLVLFLYIQSYKRLLPKAHKDSAAVADVWPSTSAFDGYFSALSPIQVLTLERFEHLGFLIQIGEKGGEEIPLRQAPPFFANSDPDMPAVPVPATKVHDWLLQNIADSLEHTVEKAPVKENGPVNTSDLDVAMTDACMSHPRTQSSSSLSGTTVYNNPTYSRSQTFVEGFSKASVVKQASDIKGHSVKVKRVLQFITYEGIVLLNYDDDIGYL
ncbi:putative TBCC domain-containing protein 1 [Cocos nucifera]|uniref:Putative TBCC domain-containing protein 1 n=1 Tax=Cocos nucifera TaxID=13894 RepID=A0A8K0N8X9_COCNU|nr:putative TBCC domain-containing protein 1 [Cocos nucifera]